jgi:hypothetical protein
MATHMNSLSKYGDMWLISLSKYGEFCSFFSPKLAVVKICLKEREKHLFGSSFSSANHFFLGKNFNIKFVKISLF